MAEGLKISPTAWGPEPSSIMANVFMWSYIILIYYLALYHELRFWLAKKCWNSRSQGRPDSFPSSVLVIVITHSHIPQIPTVPPKRIKIDRDDQLICFGNETSTSFDTTNQLSWFHIPLVYPTVCASRILLFFVEFLIFAVYFNPHWC